MVILVVGNFKRENLDMSEVMKIVWVFLIDFIMF